jgi:hypothetical protein
MDLLRITVETLVQTYPHGRMAIWSISRGREDVATRLDSYLPEISKHGMIIMNDSEDGRSTLMVGGEIREEIMVQAHDFVTNEGGTLLKNYQY